MDAIQAVLAMEVELLQPSLRASAARLEEIFADGFIEIGQSGTLYNKCSIIATLTQENNKEIAATEMSGKTISNNLILVYYKTKSGSKKTIHRHSLWENSPLGWKILYHEAEPSNG